MVSVPGPDVLWGFVYVNGIFKTWNGDTLDF